MYGGHYNYYHLQRIWPGKYEVFNNYYAGKDSLQVTDASLSGFLGFNVVKWNSTDSRYLSGYEKFDDLPTNAKVYGIIHGVKSSSWCNRGKLCWLGQISLDKLS